MRQPWQNHGVRGTPVRTFRLADELWFDFQQKAALGGLTTSEYLRRIIAVNLGVAEPAVSEGLGIADLDDVFDQIERDLKRVRRKSVV